MNSNHGPIVKAPSTILKMASARRTLKGFGRPLTKIRISQVSINEMLAGRIENQDMFEGIIRLCV
jgi:hypothetical protein